MSEGCEQSSKATVVSLAVVLSLVIVFSVAIITIFFVRQRRISKELENCKRRLQTALTRVSLGNLPSIDTGNYSAAIDVEIPYEIVAVTSADGQPRRLQPTRNEPPKDRLPYEIPAPNHYMDLYDSSCTAHLRGYAALPKPLQRPITYHAGSAV